MFVWSVLVIVFLAQGFGDGIVFTGVGESINNFLGLSFDLEVFCGGGGGDGVDFTGADGGVTIECAFIGKV